MTRLSPLSRFTLIVFAIAFACFIPELAFAQEGAGGGGASGADMFFIAIVVSSGFSMAIASALCGIGQGWAIAKTCEGIARQPSASGDLFRTLILGLAFIESLALYVLVVGLILFFANPFAGVYNF